MNILDNIKEKIKEKIEETIDNSLEKAEKSIHVMDKRMQRRFAIAEEKAEKIGDKADAIFGIGDYKYSSISERLNNIFTSDDSNIKNYSEYGDIIGINRGIYEHYGIYLGNNRVIHYVGLEGDFQLNNIKIQETGMEIFLRGSNEYFVFSCEGREKNRIIVEGAICLGNLKSLFKDDKLLEIYSPSETVERAKSRLGETKYNLVTNNCEHFAIWCKTGISESLQVNKILKVWRRGNLTFN